MRIGNKNLYVKKNRSDTFVSNLCFSFGADEGTRAFSGAPRSDVINVVLCHQAYHYPNPVRQSVLLPQNGSHPRVPSYYGSSKKMRYPTWDISFFWCGRRDSNPHGCPQEPETCASANFATSAYERVYVLYTLYLCFL